MDRTLADEASMVIGAAVDDGVTAAELGKRVRKMRQQKQFRTISPAIAPPLRRSLRFLGIIHLKF
jgi:hypothetical protein